MLTNIGGALTSQVPSAKMRSRHQVEAKRQAESDEGRSGFPPNLDRNLHWFDLL